MFQWVKRIHYILTAIISFYLRCITEILTDSKIKGGFKKFICLQQINILELITTVQAQKNFPNFHIFSAIQAKKATVHSYFCMPCKIHTMMTITISYIILFELENILRLLCSPISKEHKIRISKEIFIARSTKFENTSYIKCIGKMYQPKYFDILFPPISIILLCQKKGVRKK